MRKAFFLGFAAAALLLAASARNAQAQSQSETPKIEIGAHYTLLRISGFGANDANDSGVGGRITYNINSKVGIEGEYNFFPEGRVNFATLSNVLDSSRTQGLFGVKYAIARSDSAGIFAKARPGFMRFSQGTPAVGTASSETQFAFDYGGILELYPSRAVALRFDVGDTVIRYDSSVFANPFFTHNLQIGAGVALRF
ncbi:MAG TPA: outer membrane beta-barrel protein [Blastocatellia bacterium]